MHPILQCQTSAQSAQARGGHGCILSLCAVRSPVVTRVLRACQGVRSAYLQTQRWIKAGVFEAIVHDVRMLLRAIAERMPRPRAAIFDARTRQSSSERGERAGWDGHKRRSGSNDDVLIIGSIAT